MAAIGSNWADIWKPVWKPVWTQEAPTPPDPDPTHSGGTRATRRRRAVAVFLAMMAKRRILWR